MSNRPLGLCLSPFPLRHKCQYIPRFPNGECEADTAHAEFTKGIKETLPHNSWPLSSVQSLSHVQLFVAPWTVARRASLSITNSWSLLKLMAIESVMPSNHLILCLPLLLCLQSFPASGSFPVSQFFKSGGQSIGVSASASVLPMNIQD